MKRLLAVIANGRHAERNRLAVMLSHLASADRKHSAGRPHLRLPITWDIMVVPRYFRGRAARPQKLALSPRRDIVTDAAPAGRTCS